MRVVLALSAAVHLAAATWLRDGRSAVGLAVVAVLAGLAAWRAGRAGALAALAASLAGAAVLTGLWRPALWPAVDSLRGLGFDLRVAGWSVDLLGLGWWGAGLVALAAARARRAAALTVAATVLVAASIVPQGRFDDRLEAPGEGTLVEVLVEGEAVERGWVRAQLPPQAPLLHLPALLRSELVLTRIAEGAEAHPLWSLGRAGLVVGWSSKVLAPLALVAFLLSPRIGTLALAVPVVGPPVASLVLALVGWPLGLAPATALLAPAGGVAAAASSWAAGSWLR